MKQRSEDTPLFSVFTSSKKDEQRGIGDLRQEILVDLKRVKTSLASPPFVKHMRLQVLPMETSPEVFFLEDLKGSGATLSRCRWTTICLNLSSTNTVQAKFQVIGRSGGELYSMKEQK